MTSATLFFVPLAVVLVASSSGLAAGKVDFSGSYTLTGRKGTFKLKKGEMWTLRVVQTESTIEVTKTIDGKHNVNRFHQ